MFRASRSNVACMFDPCWHALAVGQPLCLPDRSCCSCHCAREAPERYLVISALFCLQEPAFKRPGRITDREDDYRYMCLQAESHPSSQHVTAVVIVTHSRWVPESSGSTKLYSG